MTNTIISSSIWRTTLGDKSPYANEYSQEVETLRNSFYKIREKANTIATNIQESQPGLTLHDSSHLDALWETASIIAGDGLQLNPIEAYIFGCSVLFHDLGMALVLWNEGIENIKASKEFRDLAFGYLKEILHRDPTKEELNNPPELIIKKATSTRVRDLHAFKAKELPIASLKLKGDVIYLIEEADIRQKIGRKIGEIAESHWWNIDDIRIKFNKIPITAAPTGFPSKWTINNIKLACLLRLADYIHIDDRRAPLLSYALLQPTGESEKHWSYQNKMNRAFPDGDRLLFTSHSPFNYSDSEAWWLAYKTISDIDKEMRAVDDLLIHFSFQRFECRGVKNIESPTLFAECVKTENWEPANTQFKISDFKSLIEKFGGEQLYGHRPDVPIRELIQNACDALQAKRYYLPDFEGKIQIRYYEDHDQNCWIEIEDNGIGMSKSTLLYGLLDFGTSYWKSSLIRQEHPGLISSGFSPTGTYGIGFFSVFMIAHLVQVITKPIGDTNTIMLEFSNGISFHPILRIAEGKEKRVESGTLIRIQLDQADFIDKLVGHESDGDVNNPLTLACRKIAPALPEKLVAQFKDLPAEIILHQDDWITISPLHLLKRVCGFGENEPNEPTITRLEYISEFVRPIYRSSSNEVIARATLVKQLPASNSYSGYGVVTVGGLTQSRFYRFPGIWLGKSNTVTRNYAYPICELEDLYPWLHEQYRLIVNSNKLSRAERTETAKIIFSLGYPCKDLPIANTLEGWYSYTELAGMKHNDHVLLCPIMEEPEGSLTLLPNIIYAQLTTPVLELNYDSNKVVWADELDKLTNNSRQSFSLFTFTIQAVCDSWGVESTAVIKESFVRLDEKLLIKEVYKDEYNQLIKKPVAVLINPEKTNRKTILEKYPEWVGTSSEMMTGMEKLKNLERVVFKMKF